MTVPCAGECVVWWLVAKSVVGEQAGRRAVWLLGKERVPYQVQGHREAAAATPELAHARSCGSAFVTA